MQPSALKLTADHSKLNRLLREALQVLRANDPRRVTVTAKLALTIATDADGRRDPHALDEAITMLSDSKVQTAIPEVRQAISETIRMLVRQRAGYSGAVDIIAKGVATLQLLVNSTTESDPDHVQHLKCLGGVLLYYSDLVGDLGTAEAAVATLRKATSANGEDEDGEARIMLADALMNQSMLSYSRSSLDECIDILTPISQSIVATDSTVVRNAMGDAYLTRYEHDRDLTDLTTAIDTLRGAVKVSFDGAQQAGSLANLGSALKRSFEASRDHRQLDEAISVLRAASKLAEKHCSQADAAGCLSTLGLALIDRCDFRKGAALLR